MIAAYVRAHGGRFRGSKPLGVGMSWLLATPIGRAKARAVNGADYDICPNCGERSDYLTYWERAGEVQVDYCEECGYE